MSVLTRKLLAPSGTPPAPTTDPNFNQVALLLHGDGTNGAQNNTFLDSSTNNFTITRTGNVAQGTFSPFSLAEGQWSNYLDGTGDFLTAPYNSAFDVAGAFTFECWLYLNTQLTGNGSSGTGIFVGNNTNGALQIGHHATGSSGWGLGSYFKGWRLLTTTYPTLNAWNHIAITRDSSNNVAIFLNGSRVANGTSSVSFPAGVMYIGSGAQFTLALNGYVSNLRLVNGTAVYDPTQATLTVPTSPLTAITNTSLLTCQSNRFKDNSSNNFTITRNGDTKVTAFSPFDPSAAYSAGTNGGSGYFDGSGDRLQVADTSSLDLNGSAFNVEYWIYPLASPSTITVTGKMSGFTANPTAGWSMWLSSMRPTFGINGVFNSLIAPVANAIRVGEWSHIAASSDGSTYTNLYVNGVRVATTSSLLTNNTSLPMVIGSNINGTTWNNDYPVTGYIQDLRVVKGTAIYTGTTYTVPTAPLTAITNTQLLLNCTNAGIIDNSGKNDIETVGDVQISTSVKKYGTGSMAFDGSGDYLRTYNDGSITSFGAGDFTIEFWFNSSSIASTQIIYDGRPAVTNGAYPLVYLSGSKLVYYVSTAARISGVTTLSSNTWYHVAISRSGTSTKMFLNGVQEGSTYTDSTVYLVAANRPSIGTGGYDATSSFNGYIDDLRITKGIARYTANFTPPTQAFPDY